MLGEWYLPPGKCQAISTITEGIISISHPAPLSSQTRIPQTSSPLVDKSQATQAALLQIRRSEPCSGLSLVGPGPGALLCIEAVGFDLCCGGHGCKLSGGDRAWRRRGWNHGD